jgi:GNAT superfamily N-acetyltransferase
MQRTVVSLVSVAQGESSNPAVFDPCAQRKARLGTTPNTHRVRTQPDGLTSRIPLSSNSPMNRSDSAICYQQITPRNVVIFKDVRLRALQDAPLAFGSTYADELKLTDADWLNRATRWNGERGVGFLAFDRATPCGIAGSFLDEQDPARARLISMWVAPTHRRRGVGYLLVQAVLAWARLRQVHTLALMVTSVNESAFRFYERLGFTRTGRTELYPHDPAIVEFEMSLPIL